VARRSTLSLLRYYFEDTRHDFSSADYFVNKVSSYCKVSQLKCIIGCVITVVTVLLQLLVTQSTSETSEGVGHKTGVGKVRAKVRAKLAKVNQTVGTNLVILLQKARVLVT
jgi:hypothetical protein